MNRHLDRKRKREEGSPPPESEREPERLPERELEGEPVRELVGEPVRELVGEMGINSEREPDTEPDTEWQTDSEELENPPDREDIRLWSFWANGNWPLWENEELVYP